MNASRTKQLTVIAARWILGLVFLVAAVPKILAPHDFALAVFRYQLVPYPLVSLFGIYLPWLELIAALALLFAPRFRAAAAWIVLGLLIVFTAAIAANLVRGIDIACGCFSVNPKAGHMGAWNLIRNGFLIALAVVALVAAPRKDLSSDRSACAG